MGLFGGGNSSNSTQNTSNAYDQRQVYSWDTTNYDLSNRSVNNTTTNADFSNRSVSNTTTNADFSNRSVSNTTTNADFSDRSSTSVWSDSSNRSTNTTNADFSNRSTTWSDNSDRSTTSIYNTTTDGGAVAGALGLATSSVKSLGDQIANVLGFASTVTAGQNASTAHAYDYADNIFHGALDAVQASDTRALDAFSRASTIQNDALAMSGNSFKQAIGQVQNAYADAKGTTQAQQKIMIGVLIVAAVAVLAPRLGK